MRGLKRGGVWNTLQADVHAPGVAGADLYTQISKGGAAPVGEPSPVGARCAFSVQRAQPGFGGPP
jgi:hypothetical protein